MRRLRSIGFLALAGCYATFHAGSSAPVGHGHGGAGVDLDLAGGFEHSDPRLRVGGGIALGSHGPDDPGYVTVGFDGHVVIAVGGRPYGDKWRPLLVANAVVGVGVGSAADASSEPPETYFAQTFVGFGIGSPTMQRSYHINAGHAALGLTAARYRTDSGDGFWMLGGAFEASFGWDTR